MTKPKSKSRKGYKPSATSPLNLLHDELRGLRRDLRSTVRAYTARLEIALAESTAAIASMAAAKSLPLAPLHELRDLMALLRKRKLKPEKGRRKDLRKLDVLIDELHTITHPNVPR